MKFLFKMMHYCFTLVIISLLLYSCQNSEESEIDQSFILKTNKNINNKASLDSIKDLFALPKKSPTFNTQLLKVTSKINLDNIAKTQNIAKTPPIITEDTPIVVSLKDEVLKIFDPQQNPCKAAIPQKIIDKLNKSKESPWAPNEVVNQISQYPDSVLYVPRNSVSSILHYVKIKKQDDTQSFYWPVSKAVTYNNFNFQNFLMSQYNSFFYSLDCSGYLNTALSGAGSIPVAQIKASTTLALKTQGSMFIGSGVIISPLAAAYYGNLVTIDTATRIQILSSITGIQNTTDNDIIEMNLSLECIWASNTGSSSFNGTASINGNAGASIVIAQISSSGSAGGSFNRGSSFNTYKTYFLKKVPIPNSSTITMAQIKAVLNKLINPRSAG